MATSKTKKRTVAAAVLTANELLRAIAPQVPPDYHPVSWFAEQWSMPWTSAQRWLEKLERSGMLKSVNSHRARYYGPAVGNRKLATKKLFDRAFKNRHFD